MNNSDTFDAVDASVAVKSESSIASVRRMLKNSLLISIRDSVLLKLATVDLLLVVFYIGMILGSLYLIPALAGEPCHTTEELNAFYNHHVHLGMHWISVFILIAIVYAIQFPYTLFTNFLLFTVDSEIIRVWNGQKADFNRGWRTAASHFWSLVTWSLLITPINIAWIVSMCIVIPVLTRDKTVNPFKMLGRSVMLLVKIWKEFLLGVVGMLVIVYWIFCLVFGSNAIFTAISSQCPPLIAWVLLSVCISLSLVALCFCYLFCNVYLCGQYLKASEGVEPSPAADPAELI